MSETPGFLNGFLASFSMILVSEIGDKTFFIAAIMAGTHSMLDIFIPAISALVLMTILSVALGMVLPALISRELTHYASCILFALFGIKILYSVFFPSQDDDEEDEMEEVRRELEEASINVSSETTGFFEAGENAADKFKPQVKTKSIVGGFFSRVFSPVFVQCFTMTFLAEWGDRSQISTIALAASQDPIGVVVGGCIGHSICTGIAVIGGAAIASKISERTVNLCGGILFIIFAIVGFAWGPESDVI